MILCSSAKGNYSFCLIAMQAERSNRRHRPIGVGVQGLADAFILMRYPFESPEAQRLNQHIFETIYYGALEASCELAKEQGPYETYEGSPVSKGVSTRNCPVSEPKLWKADNVTVPRLWYRRRHMTQTPLADNIATVQMVCEFTSIIWLLMCSKKCVS